MAKNATLEKASTTAPAPANDTPTAPRVRITTQVLNQIDDLCNQGTLVLPRDYHAGNALNSAWLILQDVENKDKKPLFINGQLTDIVTLDSVANALRRMVMQGMDPARNHGYFIIYGNKLTWQRSYFGDQVLAQRYRPGLAFYQDTVYDGDAIATKKRWSNTAGFIEVLTAHDKPFPRGKNLMGAYCGIFDTKNGEDLGVLLWDMDRIQKSWSKSKTAHFENSTHKVFPDEMALRTVIRRVCKPIIMASKEPMLEDALEDDVDSVTAEMEEEMAKEANRKSIGLSSPALPASTVTQVVTQVPVPDGYQKPVKEPRRVTDQPIPDTASFVGPTGGPDFDPLAPPADEFDNPGGNGGADYKPEF